MPKVQESVLEQAAPAIEQPKGRKVTTRHTPLPHPIPYQGSKRLLADRILSYARGRAFKRMLEPFAGSAAVTLAAARVGMATTFVIGDAFEPLAEIWRLILNQPAALAAEYAKIWAGQTSGDADYYDRVRARFNRDKSPAKYLYLLARCVKNSPRFNTHGMFNQSPDRRRLGMRPAKMESEILGAHTMLRKRTSVTCADFGEIVEDATSKDLVYLDPPWHGTSVGANKRYHEGLERESLIHALSRLNQRGISFILSYDGRCGAKSYGPPLPPELNLTRFDLYAGRSTQATLNGRSDETVESLYVSQGLAQHLCPHASSARQLTFTSFAESPAL